LRNKRLDVLRCIAVLLVMGRHAATPGPIKNIGWVGVDLFFVLSGFLISGLLFVEYKEQSSIDIARFYIRRGLKLYPAFYVLLAVTFGLNRYFGVANGRLGYLGEMFYVQNYGPSVWWHTWSLAVEEHFYFALPLLLLALIGLSRKDDRPFRAIPPIFAVVFTTCLISRIWMVADIPGTRLHDLEAWRHVYANTHTRLDSLFFGVLLGYLYHFRGSWEEWATRHRYVLVGLATILLSCMFVRLDSRFMLTLGFTALYIGFGIVLVLTLSLRNVLPRGLRSPAAQIGDLLAYVGVYSYSIYLWHVPVSFYLSTAVKQMTHFDMGPHRTDLLYFPFSIVVGIVMSKLVEYPVLRIRDRILPSGHSAPVTTTLPKYAKSQFWLRNEISLQLSRTKDEGLVAMRRRAEVGAGRVVHRTSQPPEMHREADQSDPSSPHAPA
jgi:peptidoglycan/LPS O-acetylase OafA/YrhL